MKNRNISFVRLFIKSSYPTVATSILAFIGFFYLWGLISNMPYLLTRFNVEPYNYVTIEPNVIFGVSVFVFVAIMGKKIHSFINKNEYTVFYCIPVSNMVKYFTVLAAFLFSFLIAYISSQIAVFLQVATMYQHENEIDIWIGRGAGEFITALLLPFAVFFASTIYCKKIYIAGVFTGIFSVLYAWSFSYIVIGKFIFNNVILRSFIETLIPVIVYIAAYFILKKKQNLK